MNVLWQCPSDAIAAVVLAHGAGAGMTHRNMQAIADAFERHGIATLRFNFPFIDAGKSRTDPQEVATATIATAFTAATERTALPLWLGGHSFGGRMASHAVLDRSKPRRQVLSTF
jgi:predicted alpha/beta-hydrolase family hydrolase